MMGLEARVVIDILDPVVAGSDILGIGDAWDPIAIDVAGGEHEFALLEVVEGHGYVPGEDDE